jgi:Tfp pilus assembly protein PilZ
MRVDRDFSELFSHHADESLPDGAHTNPRATTLVSAHVTSEEGEMSAACLELSAGGAYLRTTRLLAVGTDVELVIDLPRERVAVRGVVRLAHIDESGLEGVGVQLVDQSPQARGALETYLADLERVRTRATLAGAG